MWISVYSSVGHINLLIDVWNSACIQLSFQASLHFECIPETLRWKYSLMQTHSSTVYLVAGKWHEVNSLNTKFIRFIWVYNLLVVDMGSCGIKPSFKLTLRSNKLWEVSFHFQHDKCGLLLSISPLPCKPLSLQDTAYCWRSLYVFEGVGWT